MSQPRLLIVYHSQSSRSEHLALAVWAGARKEEGVKACLQRAMDTEVNDVLQAAGIILVSPENFGTVSGGMKDFLDRVFYPLERLACSSMPYALVMSAGNDGSGSIRQIERILSGIRAKKVQEALIAYGEPSGNDLEACHNLGQAMAAGLQMGVF